MTSLELAYWVSGVGSLLAVAVALWFSVQARRDAQDQRLCRVYAWGEYFPKFLTNVDVGSRNYTRSDFSDGWKLVLVNTTDYPVFEWACVLEWLAADGSPHATRLNNVGYGLLAPGRTELDWTPAIPPERESTIRVQLTFVDANGQAWVRTCQGRKRRASVADRALLAEQCEYDADSFWLIRWPGQPGG